MGDYLSPRKQQVFVRLRERIDKVRKGTEQSLRIFEASNPQRREQERQDTQEFHRRIIENRNKRAPRSVKAQESGQSKVKSESNGNCTNNEMGRNQPQVVKKAVDRKRPNPDSPNLTGTTEAINRTSALSLEASSSSSGMRGDASPAKKPCVDSKQLAPGQVPTPNQYIQQQDPNRMGANNHSAQLTDNGVSNQATHGAAGGDGIEGVQGLDLLSDIGNSESVLRLLDDPSGTHLDEMMKSGQFNPETLLSELSRLESNWGMQLGEMPDIATNSPGSQDASKQSDTKPDTASNNTETGVVPKSENSDTYDPMMEGPPNTVATDALQKGGPLPSIHEFKPSSGKGVLVKQEPQQINASRATFNGQNVQTVTSSGAQNIVPPVNQLTPMQATGMSASTMNPSMRGSFVNQQSGMSGQQVNFLSAQQQQSSRQLLLNARMPSQQSQHSRMPNSMLSNNMNASMSSADQLSQFANNSMRGQSPQPGRLPSMQSLFQDCNPPMALSSGQGGNMMTGQASQFVQHPQQQQRMASTEILQRLQKPPHYNASAEQRKFVTNSHVQSPQQGHNMQQSNSQMVIHRPPPPRYDETQHRNSMAFQGRVNQGMLQQLGQQAGMMTHMVGQQNMRSMVPGQGVQGHLNNGMSAGAGNRGMMQGMAPQQSQQQSMMQRLTSTQIRRQILQQRVMQQQSSAMGNQMNMASIPPGAVNIGQAGVAQYQQRHMPGQQTWSANQLLQHRMQQQNNNFQGNNMMQQQQPYPTQQRFPQRNIMDSNMRTFQNITSQGGMSNVTNTNPSIMAQQQFVGQPAQSQQQQTQQPTQQQQQQQPQPQQQQGSMQQPVQGNSITAMQNGSAVSGTNQSFGNNAQQMPMGMMLDSNNQQQQQQQQQSGSSDMLELLDNIIKNDGTARTNSHV